MTDDEILNLIALTSNEPTDAEMIAFARAIAAKEREACAKICESMRPSEPEFDQRFYTACTLCAEAIRARGE